MFYIDLCFQKRLPFKKMVKPSTKLKYKIIEYFNMLDNANSVYNFKKLQCYYTFSLQV